jgi:hypothetical protein
MEPVEQQSCDGRGWAARIAPFRVLMSLKMTGARSAAKIHWF